MRYVESPQSLCRFGTARCDITPPVGIYHRMWGVATHDRATGIHRPLTATAVAFQAHEGAAKLVVRQSMVDGSKPEAQAKERASAPSLALQASTNTTRQIKIDGPLETELVMVAVDHCLLWGREMDSLLQSIAAATGLAKEQLLITFSHTHAAGLMGLERVGLPGGELIPPYLECLSQHIAAIVREARASVQPATIVYGTGRCALAANRDFWDGASGQFVCGFNPEGKTDDTVLVARVTNTRHELVATLVNYACHPTTLAWENTLISPDYPGAMREVVEQATGAPCIFIQGASGDLGPREGYVGDPDVADRNGRQLGYAALSTLDSLPPAGTRFQYTGPVTSGATLGAWSHTPLDAGSRSRQANWQLRRWTLQLSYREDLPSLDQAQAELRRWEADEQAAHEKGDLQRARDSRALAERMTRIVNRLVNLPPGNTFPLPITLWRIGDAFWLAVEGEHYHLLQRSLRERFCGVPIIVATLTNGARPTYLPNKETYGKGIYQETIALLAPGSLERLIEAIGEELGIWKSEE